MGRSPSRSRQTNASPWSTKTERQRPPVNAHMNDTGAATSSGTPRASTAVFVRDRQNAFHRTSSSRLQPTGGRGASLARRPNRTAPRNERTVGEDDARRGRDDGLVERGRHDDLGVGVELLEPRPAHRVARRPDVRLADEEVGADVGDRRGLRVVER